jgi:hypothetical protein
MGLLYLDTQRICVGKELRKVQRKAQLAGMQRCNYERISTLCVCVCVWVCVGGGGGSASIWTTLCVCSHIHIGICKYKCLGEGKLSITKLCVTFNC